MESINLTETYAYGMSKDHWNKKRVNVTLLALMMLQKKT